MSIILILNEIKNRNKEKLSKKKSSVNDSSDTSTSISKPALMRNKSKHVTFQASAGLKDSRISKSDLNLNDLSFDAELSKSHLTSSTHFNSSKLIRQVSMSVNDLKALSLDGLHANLTNYSSNKELSKSLKVNMNCLCVC